MDGAKVEIPPDVCQDIEALPQEFDDAKSPELRGLFEALVPHTRRQELLAGRASDGNWPDEPSWEAFLLSLPEAELARCEQAGLHRVADELPSSMPPSLRELCDAVAGASSALGRDASSSGGGGLSNSCEWRQSAEKAEQVDTILRALPLRLVGGLGSIRRVVDAGCGKGHLTAKLHRKLGVPALGLDSDMALVATARELYPAVTFEARDIVREGLPCADGDLVVGLHPCGALGEAMICAMRSQQSGPATLATGAKLLMVPCCWHKQYAPWRQPLSSTAAAAGLRLPHLALKKASMALDASTSLAGRRSRAELRSLLRLRGVDEGELSARREMWGIHRRKALRGLRALADAALRLRGMEPATDAELAASVEAAHAPFERSRRLSLLEPVLGELIELLCTLDRALALEEAGMRVSVFKAFGAGASDRNLAILAEPATVAHSEVPPTSTAMTSEEEEERRALHYQAVLKSCRKRRAWQEAASTIGDMRASGVAIDSYHLSAAMTVCTRASEWQTSLRLFDEWVASGTQEPHRTCYNAALAACAASGRREEALALLASMDLGALKPTAGCYTAAAKACLVSGEWTAALDCFDELIRRGLAPGPADYHVAITAALTPGTEHARVASLAMAASRVLHCQDKSERGGVPAAGKPSAATLGARVGAISVGWCWSVWSTAQLLLLRDDLVNRLPSVDGSAGDELERSLNLALKFGEMPSFGSSGARSSYTLSHLPSRAMKVADILRLDAPAWLEDAVGAALLESESVVSLAAGPGFDAAALALVLNFDGDSRERGPRVVRAYDYESGWEEQCDAVAGALCARFAGSPSLSIEFARCDITLSLRHAPINAGLRNELAHSRLVLASYCVAENALALRRNDFVYFEELVAEAQPGTPPLLPILPAPAPPRSPMLPAPAPKRSPMLPAPAPPRSPMLSVPAPQLKPPTFAILRYTPHRARGDPSPVPSSCGCCTARRFPLGLRARGRVPVGDVKQRLLSLLAQKDF